MSTTIDVYGDSTTWGWDGAATDQYGNSTQVATPSPAEFEAALPASGNYVVVNYGVNGTGTTERLNGTGGVTPNWSTQMASTVATYVVFAHGLHDCIPTYNISVQTFKNNLITALNTARSNNKIIIFQTMVPSPSFTNETATYAQAMRDIATAYNVPVIDVHTYLKGVIGSGDYWAYMPDGEHPNQSTYIIIGDYQAQRFQAIVGSLSSGVEVVADRVRQVTTSTGTGDLTLGSSLTGFATIPSVCNINDKFFGVIEAVDVNNQPTGEWECGYYTYSNTNTISRTTIFSSSNSGQPVNFSAGTKHIYIDVLSYQMKYWQGQIINNPPPSATGPYGQDASLYTLSFEDNFNAGTTIDSAKWNREISYKTDNATTNFDLNSGNARIWPTLDGSGNFFERTLTTAGKFTQTYGFWEIEAKLPIGQGLSPRFELFNDDEHTVTVMAAITGGDSGGWANNLLQPVDWAMSVWQNYSGGAVYSDRATTYITPPVMSDQFHKYGVRVDATSVQFFFDGTQIGPTISHGGVMNVPLYLYLGLWLDSSDGAAAVGSGTPSNTNRYTPTGTTNAYQINYVRAWTIN